MLKRWKHMLKRWREELVADPYSHSLLPQTCFEHALIEIDID